MARPRRSSGHITIDLAYDGHSDIDDAVSRPNKIAEDNAGSPGASIVEYSYLGSGTPVIKDYATPKVRLDRGSGYASLDTLSRVSSQQWLDYSAVVGGGSTRDVFKIGHGYDRDSNRLYAENTTQGGASQVYSYDSLNRLTQYKAGLIKSDKSDTESFWTRNGQKWTLDAVGNPTSVDVWNNRAWATNWYVNTFDSANQVLTRSVRGDQPTDLVTDDEFDTLPVANWVLPAGSSDTRGSNSPDAGKFTVSAVAQDTFSGTQEEEARAFVTFGPDMGPGRLSVTSILTDLTASGASGGLVFGYKNPNDYWTLTNVSDGAGGYTNKVHHVVNGAKTQYASAAGSVDPLALDSKRGSILGGGGYEPSGGFPSGKIGLYSNAAPMRFDSFKMFDYSLSTDLMGRWTDFARTSSLVNSIEKSSSRLRLINDQKMPVLLKGLRYRKFQADFKITRLTWSNASTAVGFVFNATDQDDFQKVTIYNQHTNVAPAGFSIQGGKLQTAVTASTDTSAMPGTDSVDMWARVAHDGATVTVKTAASQSGLDSASACFTSSNFATSGGMIGFCPEAGSGACVDELTVKRGSGTAPNVTYGSAEHYEPFTVNSTSGAAAVVQSGDGVNDAAGNLTFDGQFRYSYDAWNRLVKVTKAYRDSGGTVQSGPLIATIAYDGTGRRISKAVGNSGDRDCTYHYYYDAQSQIETRDGSNLVLRQQVWGLGYIDELVQVAVNPSPGTDDDAGTSGTQDLCETKYWACCDANYNVLGLVDSSGVLVERQSADCCPALLRAQVTFIDAISGLRDGARELRRQKKGG